MMTRDTAPARWRLPLPTQPDLAATMDIQIPALAWQPTGDGGYRRTLYLDTATATVTVAEGAKALEFTADSDDPRLPELTRAMFPTQVRDLNLGSDPRLHVLADRYSGVVVMWCDPFEALVLTVLSQNRTGEIVRRVYPALARTCGGITPARLAALDLDQLRATIRSAGPYKAPRLAALAAQVATDEAAFTDRVTTASAGQALAYLEALPGVAHKTAACVLVFAARTNETLPVDVHLFRVAERLGLTSHDGRLKRATRDATITDLLSHSPDMALAHFLFLLVGRTTCTATAPRCTACLLRTTCRHANTPDQQQEEVQT